ADYPWLGHRRGGGFGCNLRLTYSAGRSRFFIIRHSPAGCLRTYSCFLDLGSSTAVENGRARQSDLGQRCRSAWTATGREYQHRSWRDPRLFGQIPIGSGNRIGSGSGGSRSLSQQVDPVLTRDIDDADRSDDPDRWLRLLHISEQWRWER